MKVTKPTLCPDCKRWVTKRNQTAHISKCRQGVAHKPLQERPRGLKKYERFYLGAEGYAQC